MPEIAAICETCAWQKDGRCYGRQLVKVTERVLPLNMVEVGGYFPGVPERWAYPPCPTEEAQNGMPCAKWKERRVDGAE